MDDDNDDFMTDTEMDQLRELNKGKKQRNSISSEVYGEHNKMTDFKPRVIEKDEKTKKSILSTMNKAFMFSNLEKDDKTIIIDALEKKEFKSTEYVIVEKDDGSELYLIESGTLECWKKFDNEDEPK